MVMDDTLYRVSEKVKNFAMIWKVDVTQVPDFTKVSTAPLENCRLKLMRCRHRCTKSTIRE
jgi:hypothetical protein